MQKVFLLLIILLVYSCSSEKKEKKTDFQTKNETVSESSISKPIPENTIVNTQVIEDKEAKDSIVNNDIPKNSKKETKVIEDDIADKKPVNKKEKEIKKIRPNHTPWNLLTKKYVSASGKVNYRGFKSNISTIEKYLSHLHVTSPKKDWTKNEKLAYWFNLYNAATIQLVANAYPVKSIKNINNGKPWDKKFIKSGNSIYSLNQIENTIVRPNFNEPRLHVAFNCAAISCPKLLNEAFTPTRLNSQLTKLSRAWVNDPSKNKITESTIQISKIFQWYTVDFKKGIIPFINTYATIKTDNSAKIQYLEYNWDLND